MTSVSLAELLERGEALGRTLDHGSVVWLQGPLGAGKTTLTRAIVRGRGGTTNAASPTYALVHHYDGARGPIHHVDCYRVTPGADLADFDWATMLAGDLLLIEWPERGGPWVPEPTVQIALAYAGADRRALELG